MHEREALRRPRGCACVVLLAASILFGSCGGSDSPAGPTPSTGPVAIQLNATAPAAGATLAIDDSQQFTTALEVGLTVTSATSLVYGQFQVELLFDGTQTPCASGFGPSQPLAAGQPLTFRVNLLQWNPENCPFPIVVSAIRVTATDSGVVQGQREFPARYTFVGRSGVAPPALGSRVVLIAGDGNSCYPQRERSCNVALAALVSPAPGETLTYAWSGCATGTGALTQCVITGLSTSTATVQVRSSRGWTASATATTSGVNKPPTVEYSFPSVLASEATNIGTGDVYDEDHCSAALVVEVSGACDRGSVKCHSYGLDLDLHTTRGPGSCAVMVTARDPWGATSTTTHTYPVARP